MTQCFVHPMNHAWRAFAHVSHMEVALLALLQTYLITATDSPPDPSDPAVVTDPTPGLHNGWQDFME